jgi:hypothetical protein
VVPVNRLVKRLGALEDELWWNFTTPRLCVAKAEPHWSRMSQPLIDADSRAKLKARIEADLLAQAERWGLGLPDAPAVGFFDLGEPMPIPAICAARSGNGKSRFVLARKNVRMICNLRLMGDWFIGPLAGLGFGRLFRDGYAPNADLPIECVLELAGSAT